MLTKILDLEKLGPTRFKAHHNQQNYRNTLFGGQVLAQALMAAGLTTDRPVHSIHASFLRAGQYDSPVFYEVEIVRDGRSVTSREVKAIQNEKVILSMMASFHIPETGYAHQQNKPVNIPPPQKLEKALTQVQKNNIQKVGEILGTSPIECIPVDFDLMEFKTKNNQADIWVRALEPLGDNALIHACALAFASDIGLITTMVLPHNVSFFSGEVIAASMDHTVWFHQPLNLNQWHLLQTQSPWTGNARGLAFGSYYNEANELIATCAQEGLIRPST